MVIISDREEFEQFLSLFKTHPSYVVPILTDVKAHTLVNSISFLYIRILDEGILEDFVLVFDHPDAEPIPYEWLSELVTDQLVFTLFKKDLIHLLSSLSLETFHSWIDAMGMMYLDHLETNFDPKLPHFIQDAHRRFWDMKQTNKTIPLMKWLEYVEDRPLRILEGNVSNIAYDGPGFEFHNNVVIPTLAFMESRGIKVDKELFIRYFGQGAAKLIDEGYVYADYNPYTTTGRITNSFRGVNFSALNKSDGTRKAFTSRFENGKIIMIDFEAFHLRLIADMIKFDLPSTPVHTFFGQQYFGKQELTQEEYETSKGITFNLLYSEKQNVSIPFFQKMYTFRTALLTKAQEQGYIESPTGRRIWLRAIEDPSESKLFNYYLQLREMEVSMGALADLVPLYTHLNSSIILYTYDAILIDYDQDEGGEALRRTAAILSQGGKYPVRVYAGPNYHDLELLEEVGN